MYENLETNIPHFLMQFSDQPSLTENQLFPSRDATLQYLKAYGDDVRHLLKFQTQLIEVLPVTNDGNDSWQVRYRSLNSRMIHEATYDAVVVASGHYSVPYLPDIQGISKWNAAYPGSISHSKYYQKPLDFANKKVLVVGNSASGQDVSAHIASCSKLPVMISVRSNPPTERNPPSKEFMPEIAEFISPSLARRAVRFSDGHVETEIDAIVFCTGYFYSYPFLSSILPPLISTGDRVQNLYQHIFSIHHPSLAFVGIPKPIIPFRTVEGQAAVIARVWSGRLDLPSVTAMQAWEESIIVEKGPGNKFHDLRHPMDFDYYDGLIEWALQTREEEEEGMMRGKLPPKWSERDRWVRRRMVALKEAFALAGEARHEIRTMEELGFSFEHDKEHCS